MNTGNEASRQDLFESAEWYDVGIRWDARLAREIPLLREVLGSPGHLGVIDAGCGPGHHAIALAQAGYRVIGVDAKPDMLRVAAEHAQQAHVSVQWIEATYEGLLGALTPPFDGLYCLGNALAAAGSEDAVRHAVRNFAALLRPGGRLVLHVLNFERMRREHPCVRGPRVCQHSGVEYVSTRVYHLEGDQVAVTNVTLWKDQTWRMRAHTGNLHAIRGDRLTAWLRESGVRVDAFHGDYQRSSFDPDRSEDQILVSTKT